MNWLLIGVASTALFAAISIVDKILLERFFKNNWAYPFFTALFLGLYSLIILVIRLAQGLFTSPSITVTLMAMLPGILHYGAALITTRALLRSDASTVFGLSQVSPLFAVIWGLLFFGNVYDPINYFGVVLLVMCAVFLAWEKPEQSLRQIKFNKVLGLILVSAFIRSLSDLFIKVAVTELAYWDAFALSRLGSLIPAFYLFGRPQIRTSILAPVISKGWKIIGMAGFVEFFALINLMLITLAFSLGPLALVSATQATLPLFILVFTFLLNRIWKGVVPTRDNKLSLSFKLLLSAGIVAGVLLLYI